jgi:hypothetical protein
MHNAMAAIGRKGAAVRWGRIPRELQVNDFSESETDIPEIAAKSRRSSSIEPKLYRRRAGENLLSTSEESGYSGDETSHRRILPLQSKKKRSNAGFRGASRGLRKDYELPAISI